MLAPDDPDSNAYRHAIANDPRLAELVDLRFAKGDQIAEKLRDAEVATCGNLTREQIDMAKRLRWISFWSAGLDGKVTEQIRERKLLLTNNSGVHGANIAEHVLAFMLIFTRRMDVHFRSQLAGRWERGLPANKAGADELTGQTLGIVGLGRIGEALALRAAAFDMRIVAAKRDPSFRHGGAPIEAVFGLDDLPRLLEQSDHICISLPHTPETDRMFDAEMLAHCRPTAYLYNIARGRIIDEAALIDALSNNRLAGAGLDVFEKEPLPPDSPLWTLPNVLITPHTAGITPHYFKRTAALFAENLVRYLAHEPLNNLYDASRGY
jgi:phosphoglycerate dehydrogenase-like enzyme